jgi:hypothetical protein
MPYVFIIYPEIVINNKTGDIMNNFYVYALKHPDTDKFFYIGKGTKDRINASAQLSQVRKKSNYWKHKVLTEIYNSGKEPIKIKLLENISEDDALCYETLLISKYGRLCDKSGILTNYDKGGKKGSTGFKRSDELKEMHRLLSSGVKQSQSTIDKRKLKITGLKRSNEQIYNCLKSSITGTIKAEYCNIISLFEKGKFIETIHIITGIQKVRISKVVKRINMYKAAINGDNYYPELENSTLKWSCQTISHILKDKDFYKNAIRILNSGNNIHNIVLALNSNHTRARYIQRNKDMIQDIINTYD